MNTNGKPTENGSVASSESDQSAGCPVCGGPIQFVERRGPSDVSVAPCGHDITDLQAQALSTTEQRVATDGGNDELTCEVPEVDEHCGDVKIVLNEGGDVLAMCWECRKRFAYERVVDEDPDPALTDGIGLEVTADNDAVPLSIDAHLYAYVRDGATAVVWTFNTTVAGEVQVGEFHVYQASDRAYSVQYADIPKGRSITEFAHDYAADRGEAALEAARDTFDRAAGADTEEVGA